MKNAERRWEFAGASAKLLTKDETRRIAANVAKQRGFCGSLALNKLGVI